MAGHSIHFPKYSIEAKAGVNHRGRLTGAGKSAAIAQRIHELAPGESILEGARLVVLVPSGEVQEAQLAQQVWRLASPNCLPVLMLAIARDYETETALLRRLASLAAFTRDRLVKVKTRIVHTSSWASALREVLLPGDVILGSAEQEVGMGLLHTEPLCEAIARSVQAPVYVLSGFCSQSPGRFPVLRKTLAWALLPVILAGFAGLDIQVVNQVLGTWQQVLLIVLLIIEIGTIWLWNTWIG